MIRPTAMVRFPSMAGSRCCWQQGPASPLTGYVAHPGNKPTSWLWAFFLISTPDCLIKSGSFRHETSNHPVVSCFLFSACGQISGMSRCHHYPRLLIPTPKALREIDSLLLISSKSGRSAKSMLPLRQSRQLAFSWFGQAHFVVDEAQRIQLLARRLDF